MATKHLVDPCPFCGKEEADCAIRTGVSAYPACKTCWLWWAESDQTREALNELRMGPPRGE